jgi:hypothetical protein
MSEDRRKILNMVSEGKISVDEAEKLLSALSAGDSGQNDNSSELDSQGKAKPKYLRVMVEPGPGSETSDKVNIRIPMKLIRAGLKFAAFMPKDVHKKVNSALHEKGIDMDFNQLKPEDLEELVTHLDDLTVDVEGKEKVRIFCE